MIARQWFSVTNLNKYIFISLNGNERTRSRYIDQKKYMKQIRFEVQDLREIQSNEIQEPDTEYVGGSIDFTQFQFLEYY